MDIGVIIAKQQFLIKEVKEFVMKKIVLLICIILTLALLTACNTSQNIDANVSELETEKIETLYEQDEIKENLNIEIEQVPLYSNSVDELIETINNIRQNKENDTNNVSTVNALVVPDFTIEGYYLFMIEVTEVSVIYYYTPLSVSRSDGLIDDNRDYVVTVRRSEYVNASDPLQPLIDQLKITPDKDGYLYDTRNREITFAYDNVWVSIRVPENITDYEKIKSLCTVKTVKVE